MTLQMKPPGAPDALPYAPARDIVYMIPRIVENVADSLEDERFPALHKFLKQSGVTPNDLGDACTAFIKFMQTAHENPSGRVYLALENSGWFDVKDEARIAYTFYVGSMMTGVMWSGIRDSSMLTDDVLNDMNRLTGLAAKVQKALYRPRWRRTLTRLWAKVKRWLILQLRESD